jgi:hypothetical protein
MRLLLIIALVAIIGCSKEQKKTVEKLTEDVSGYSAVKTGNAMKAKLKDFEKSEQERIDSLESIK